MQIISVKMLKNKQHYKTVPLRAFFRRAHLKFASTVSESKCSTAYLRMYENCIQCVRFANQKTAPQQKQQSTTDENDYIN